MTTQIELSSLIEESVQLYTAEEINATGFHLKFPSMVRPVIQWIFEMYNTILKPQ